MSEILQHNFEEPNDNDHEKENEKESRIEYLQENEEEIARELLSGLDEKIGEGESSDVLIDSQRGDVCYKIITEGFHVCTPKEEAEFLEEVRSIRSDIKVPAPLMTISIDVELDSGEERHINALAMERIHGVTLEEIHFKEEPFPTEAEPESMEDFKELRATFREMRELIEEMNRNLDIYHNDLSERNIMLDKNGDCWLIDFGEAKRKYFQDKVSHSDDEKLKTTWNKFLSFASTYVKNLQDD